MGIAEQLDAVNKGFTKIAAIATLKSVSIVIGESAPEGRAACPGPQNAYRNGTMYRSYTAASFFRIWQLAKRHGVNLDGALTWAFTFEDQAWFAGYRPLASNGIDLPVMNVFRLFAKMGATRLSASSDDALALDDVMGHGVRARPDVGVLASKTADGKVAVLSWHYHDDDVKGLDATITVKLQGLGKGASAKVTQWRVDQSHANAFTAWQAMGSPQSPNAMQHQALEAASAMPAVALASLALKDSAASLSFALARQDVTLLIIE